MYKVVSKVKRAVAPTHVRKNWMKLLCASLALVLIGFVSCKKDKDMMVTKAVTEVGGIYNVDAFDKNATYYCAGDKWNTVEIQFDNNHVNGWFVDIFTTNTATDVEYSSFCGHVNSSGFGKDVYAYYDKTAAFRATKDAEYQNILKALNYIYNKWGSLDVWAREGGNWENVETTGVPTKTVAAMVIQVLLNDIPATGVRVIGDGMTYWWCSPVSTTLTAVIDNAVAEVLANYASYNGPAHATEFVYLAGPNYPNDVIQCQPQIIPLKKIGKTHECEDILPYTDFDKTHQFYSAPFNAAQGGTYVNWDLGRSNEANHYSVRYTAADPSGPQSIGAYPVNNWFGDFGVVDMTTGKKYPSFCAHFASKRLGGHGDLNHRYVNKTSEFIGYKGQTTYNNVLAALNYIYETYGSVDSWNNGNCTNDPTKLTKMITNIVIWMLVDDGVTKAHFEYCTDLNWDIQQVMTNYSVNVGKPGTITEFVFLADPSYNGATGYENCQPQIVPIYDCPTPDPVATGLNWNNGVAKPEKDGENGVGLNQFTLDGFTLKNNKNYLARTNFLNRFDVATPAAPTSKEEKGYFTLIERDPLLPSQFNGNGKFKSYHVYVALYKTTSWKFYEGVITVDNPGGNNNKQKLVFKGTNNFNRIKK